MSFINKFFNYFLLSLIVLTPLTGKTDYLIENQSKAFDTALTISDQGILKQKDNGFVYLDVANEFINSVATLIDLPGELRSPPTATRSVGAHISVFYEKEEIAPLELGSTFSFEPKDIRSFTLHTRDGLKKLWLLAVDSPDLENLRESYNCSSKLKGHDFHITLGKQMPSAPEGWKNVEVISPLNYLDQPYEGLSSEGDFNTVENNALQEIAKHVDNVAQLNLKNNGFVYLDVDDRYVEEMTEYLPVTGDFKVLSTGPRKMGAHISVIYEDEMIGHEIWNLSEAGQWFTFQVKELRYVDRGAKRLWLLAVEAPGLEHLRTQYGLKPKLQGHDFHITLGYESLVEAACEEEKDAA
ncbi:MAG: hypothetical protein K940chlam3_01511 [Chlamydiae bacterium]|nr:hypothetical protein [Chlamydiota bacterium]